jgi:ADP-ribose pyrophosphatase
MTDANADAEADPWTVLESRDIYENPWMRVVEHQVLTPAGKPGIYGVVHPINLATGVVPLHDDGTITLVGQYRFPLGLYSWEMPEGGGAPDVDPLISAQRELTEETGLTARRWLPLQKLHLSNCITDETAYLYLAWGLEQGQDNPDDTERLTIRRLPFTHAFAMAMNGEITDAMTVTALFKCRLLAATGGLPTEIAALLRAES